VANYPYVVAEQRAGTQLTSTLPPDERRDREKVNEAVAEAERAKAESSDDAVYDDRHYVQCRWCGKWINGSDPARLAEHPVHCLIR
jgi:RNA polymerase-binding transcription factor DksA